MIIATGYSTTYNTPFSFKSSAKDLCPTSVHLRMGLGRADMLTRLPTRDVGGHHPKTMTPKLVSLLTWDGRSNTAWILT